MGILTIVPTRGRPKAAAELLAAYRDASVQSDTSILFAVDDDDPELRGYYDLIENLPDGFPMMLGPRLRMGPTLNLWAERAATTWSGRYDIIGFMGDDHRPRTPGWDARVSDALRPTPGVAYGNDLIQGPSLPTAVFVSAQVIRRLGYIAPPGLTHLYLDNFWLELGHATTLLYLGDVVFEHLHPIAGKAEWDAGYIEVNSGGTQEHDRLEFERYMREDWPTEREKLSGG